MKKANDTVFNWIPIQKIMIFFYSSCCGQQFRAINKQFVYLHTLSKNFCFEKLHNWPKNRGKNHKNVYCIPMHCIAGGPVCNFYDVWALSSKRSKYFFVTTFLTHNHFFEKSRLCPSLEMSNYRHEFLRKTHSIVI